VHSSLLNEDLIQPKKLEMGISHGTGGRTGHFDWGRHETTPGWSLTGSYHRTERCTTRVRYTLQGEPFADSSRNFIVHSHRLAGIVLPEGFATRRLPQLLRPTF
jgi:hypothetical protein